MPILGEQRSRRSKEVESSSVTSDLVRVRWKSLILLYSKYLSHCAEAVSHSHHAKTVVVIDLIIVIIIRSVVLVYVVVHSASSKG